MLIRVRFADNRIRQIPSQDLEKLIRSREIVAFERSSGWIEVGSASLRKVPPQPDGCPEPPETAERRAVQAYLQLLREVDSEDDS